jgi:glucosamine-6-phosphate deaminase
VKVTVSQDEATSAALAARHVATAIAQTPGAVLGVATGSSPQPLYRALGELVRAGELDLSATRAFALDEYIGLSPTNPQSYHAVIDRDVTRALRMDPALVRVPDGFRPDPEQGALDYERAIAQAGGVTVQILGIGANGHIGFNEPGSSPDSATRVVMLAPETVSANARYFPEESAVPREAVSQGLATILSARTIVLVANGETKAAAVRAAVEGPVTIDCPASFLQRHTDVTLYLDAGAASKLSAI